MHALRIGFCLLLTFATRSGFSAPVGQPLYEQTDVFVAGQDGVFEYRIPGLVTSNQGTLLAFCDARMRKAGDPPNTIHLVLKRSFDAGKTWGPLMTLAENGDGAVADSCGVVDRQTGTIWIFSVYCPAGVGSYNAAPGLSGATFLYKAVKSDDDGATWSKPIDVTAMVKKPEWSAGSTGIGRGMQLRNGRLIVPRYRATYQPGNTTPLNSESYISYSDDHGKTWQIGAVANVAGGTNECQVAELVDGTLLLNMRGVSGNHRKVARSRDGGATWTDIHEDAVLIAPRCQGSLQNFTDTIDQDKNRLLFGNPASLERKNYTVRLSYDEGRTWPVAKQIFAGPAAYSCLTILADQTAACLHERGEKSPYEKISFARFNVEWLTDGKDTIAAKK